MDRILYSLFSRPPERRLCPGMSAETGPDTESAPQEQALALVRLQQRRGT